MPARRRGNRLDLHALPYAAGAIGFAAVMLIWRDFLPQWQAFPKLGHRDLWLWASAALLGLGGMVALWPRAGQFRLLLPLLYLAWSLGLALPPLVARPGLPALLELAAPLALAAGGAVLCLGARPGGLRTTLRIAFGLCILAFGIDHLLHPEAIAQAIPDALPRPRYWAYAIAAGQALAGAAILLGRSGAAAATALALGYAVAALAIDAPQLWRTPLNRPAWVALSLAASLAGAAWLVRGVAGAARRARGFSGR